MGNLFAKQDSKLKNADDGNKGKKARDVFPVSRPFYSPILALFCDTLERILVYAFHGNSRLRNHFMLGNYAPVEEFGPERVLSVKGELPECLNGEFVRIGPNPRFEPTAAYHWFDGDGMLHGLRIKSGKVSYVSRYVRTSRLAQEEYWGGPKFKRIGDMKGKYGLATLLLNELRLKLGILDTSNGGGTGNTALTFHNGKLLTLNEGDKPYLIRVLEDGDLETVARIDYDKRLNHPFTAHPKLDANTGELFTFGYRVDAPPYVSYRVISKDGVIGDLVTITLPEPIMMHDFAITENYAIFMDLPMLFKPKDMVKKDQLVFSFDETRPARFGVLPRYDKTEAQIRWFELPAACMIFHTVNAWEEEDEVVLIACRSPNLDLESVDLEKINAYLIQLWEYRFNMKSGKASERRLGDFFGDFPRINEYYIGRKNRYVYTGIFSDATRIIGVAKVDLTLEPTSGGRRPEVGGNLVGVFYHGDQRFGSEPVYVPRNPGMEVAEDDGYVLNFVFDEKLWVSEVVVLDAKTMSPDPVAVIELPARLPYGFHGLFVPEAELSKQTQDNFLLSP